MLQAFIHTIFILETSLPKLVSRNFLNYIERKKKIGLVEKNNELLAKEANLVQTKFVI